MIPYFLLMLALVLSMWNCATGLVAIICGLFQLYKTRDYESAKELVLKTEVQLLSFGVFAFVLCATWAVVWQEIVEKGFLH